MNLPNNFVINCNSKEEIVTIFRELPYDLAINFISEEEVVAGFHELPYDLSICYKQHRSSDELMEIIQHHPLSVQLNQVQPTNAQFYKVNMGRLNKVAMD